MNDIHSEKFIKNLFDEMSKTYGFVNIISSLGFTYFWRKQAVNTLPGSANRICDLMTGGGETLGHIKKKYGKESHVDLVDWSDEMCSKARSIINRRAFSNCTIINANALNLPSENQSYDAVISTFGLKTLANSEITYLAKEIKRVLKPNGHFSLLEFSIPQNRCIRFLFRIYVKHYVPFLGRISLGNPDNYRMLWLYTNNFQNCSNLQNTFEKEGFHIKLKSYFLGSATQLIGKIKKPSEDKGN